MNFANQVNKLETVDVSVLFDLSLRSANANSKVVYLYEIDSLSELISLDKAELIRQEFLRNGVKVKQITNKPVLPKFSANTEFTDRCMLFRYVPKSIYDITREVLIFDNTVAIYYLEGDEVKLLIIEDEAYAKTQVQLHNLLWDQGLNPKTDFAYEPNHSFYNSKDLYINGIQVIVYPDADAKISFDGMTWEDIEARLKEIFDSNVAGYANLSHCLVFMWNYEGARMFDIWKFFANKVDDRSGPLSEVTVYRNEKVCTDLSIASGNTHIVLGFEEKQRRQSTSDEEYLKNHPPLLPLEICNGKDFIEEKHL